MPAYTPLYRFLRRLDEPVREQLLRAVVQRLVPQPTYQLPVAVDVTGLAPRPISIVCVKRAEGRSEGFPWRHWLKWTMVVDVDRQLMAAQRAAAQPMTAPCGARWATLLGIAYNIYRLGFWVFFGIRRMSTEPNSA